MLGKKAPLGRLDPLDAKTPIIKNSESPDFSPVTPRKAKAYKLEPLELSERYYTNIVPHNICFDDLL
jgi:hypothetical protein